MPKYRISKNARADLIRIHQYGVLRFGMAQTDQYFETFFDHFDIIASQPYAFEAVDGIRKGYRRCAYGSDSIYYRINEGVVEIMANVGRQDLKNIL